MGFPDPIYRRRPHPWHGLETDPVAPEIPEIYGREHVLAVVEAAMHDYENHYGG